MARAKNNRKFNEIFVLDTNIILNDVENLFQLSDNGNNLLVLPETVLDELDSKKSGFEDINFQAREFGRVFETAEVINVDRTIIKSGTITQTHLKKDNKNVYIDVVAKSKYSSDNDNSISANIRNDRKIIEVARDLTILYKETVTFYSLDTMCRHRALSLDIKVSSLKLNEDKVIQLYAELEVQEHKDYYEQFEIETMDIPKTVQHIQVTDDNGHPKYYYRTGTIFKEINEKELNRQEVNPQNIGQKALSSMMLDDYYNVVISNSPAGCVLPGTTIDVEFDEKYLTTDEIKEKFNLTKSDLNKLRKKNLVKYKKLTYREILYDLSYFTKVTLDYLKLTPSQKIIFDNDKKYNNKYLKLRYWMGTNKDLDYSLKLLKKLRHKHLQYFEPDIDDLISNNFNPKNINNTIIKLQQKIIVGLPLPFSNLTEEFWEVRGYSKEEAKQKVQEK